MQKEESGIKMEVNKKALAIEKLQFYYEVPDTLQVGDTITLKATLTELVEDKENTLENADQANEVNSENSMQEGNKNVIEITLTIVDKEDKSIVEDNNKTNIQKQEEKEESKVQTTITQKQQEEPIKTTSVMGTSKTITTASSITQEETYQGSYDNYLTDIQIEGYCLSPSFSKTNQTYFITVENEVTQLAITATACDETASIQIYGNTDLQEGVNKILISVTAENKEVRTYRIYVIKEA
ncbi:MAG: cadherin-like beta sandwich domain-containing protein [Clostridia bacterium]